jgi:methyl-accepting chemotaxis protein
VKTIRARIVALVALAIVGLAVMCTANFLSARRLSEAASRLSDVSLASIESLERANRMLARQGALVGQAPGQLEAVQIEKDQAEFATLGQSLQAELQKLGSLVVDPGMVTDVKAFVATVPGFAQQSSQVFKLAANFQQQDAVEALKTNVLPLLNKLDTGTQSLMGRALQLTQKEPARLTEMAQASSRWGMGLAGGLVLLMVITSGWLVESGINRPLRGMLDRLSSAGSQTASAAGQVSSSSQSLAEGASEQAASLEETTASLEEMAGMTKRNAENASNANQLANQARQAADNGAADMQAMNAAMTDIKVSSDDIAKIIKTIDEIAFQTNILALNAAVEAARAGEAGMGFAVVAEEVRNLAQRSAQAAKETAAKIEGAIGKTAQGVQISAKVAAGLAEIVEKVRRVDALVAEVASASREQSQGVDQINSAIVQMDKVVQSNAGSAEESAAAAEELNAQAAVLNNAVADLQQLVGAVQKETKLATPAKPAHPPTVAARARSAPRYAATSAPSVGANGHNDLHFAAPEPEPAGQRN